MFPMSKNFLRNNTKKELMSNDVIQLQKSSDLKFLFPVHSRTLDTLLNSF